MSTAPAIPSADMLSVLTKREVVVLRMVGRCLTDNEIAERLARERSTIRTHVQRMMVKLGVKRRAVLVRFAVRAGEVEV